MKQTRDYSTLYAALAGFVLFLAVLLLMTDHFSPWHDSTDFDRYFPFPEGTQYQQTDSHGSFLGDGVTFLTAQIPRESSPAFLQTLQEKGFTDSPLPQDIREKAANHPETASAATAAQCLWWFEDESPEDTREKYTNYTLHIYDPVACVYYYIEYDS